jgi:hypothetical protein
MIPDNTESNKSVIDTLLGKYTRDEIKAAIAHFNQHKVEWADTVQENLEAFPFTLEQVRDITITTTTSWLHPLTQISHALLKHYHVIEDPLMLHSSEKDDESGRVSRSGCHCFYATVTYDDHGITVYDNYGMGGMCPEKAEFVRAFIPLPDWMAPHLQTLHHMAELAMSAPHTTFAEPVTGYNWPSTKRLKAQDLESGFAL